MFGRGRERWEKDKGDTNAGGDRRGAAVPLPFPLITGQLAPLGSGDHITRDFAGAWPPLPTELPAGPIGLGSCSIAVCVHPRGPGQGASEKELATSPAVAKRIRGAGEGGLLPVREESG